ncbi:hypothetical protein L596_005767 [Steinernema carpocapsae]|uniref:Uncharacterized protein n=1 Tax=Steinernema carpocapsae TaxID=34508 RepID=A0A4U8V0B3_STECR|nr:hypothetical protein L596_005767 [Steinernema carpocapsae]
MLSLESFLSFRARTSGGLHAVGLGRHRANPLIFSSMKLDQRAAARAKKRRNPLRALQHICSNRTTSICQSAQKE